MGQEIEMLEAPDDVTETAIATTQQGSAITIPAARQLSAVEYAMQHGASAADVRALVELQIQMDNHKLAMLKQQDEREREERERLAVLAFRRDFAAFRDENITIPKTKKVDQRTRDGGQGPKFMQSEFDVVMSMLSPALSRHGFSIRHDQKFTARPWKVDDKVTDEPWVIVTCFLEHRDGHSETLILEGPPDSSGKKNPLQEMQSSGSFLKRQSVLAITGTATGGEDDENGMSGGKAERGGGARDHEDLLDKGQAAAMEGMASLTAWWGALTARQRSALNKDFPSMRQAAKEADRA